MSDERASNRRLRTERVEVAGGVAAHASSTRTVGNEEESKSAGSNLRVASSRVALESEQPAVLAAIVELARAAVCAEQGTDSIAGCTKARWHAEALTAIVGAHKATMRRGRSLVVLHTRRTQAPIRTEMEARDRKAEQGRSQRRQRHLDRDAGATDRRISAAGVQNATGRGLRRHVEEANHVVGEARV